MSFTDAAKNAAVDALTVLGAKISLHSADPGGTGANEITTSGTRQTTVWPASAAGVSAGSAVAFTSVAAGPILYGGVWSSAGVFRWGWALDPPVTLGATGDVTVDPVLSFPT